MSRVEELIEDIEYIEDQLVELESEGIIGGAQFDALIAQLTDAEGELSDHLRYGNED